MGRVGSCFDNAAAEAFFSTLEHEVLSRHHFRTRAKARAVVVPWCQEFYNVKRRHSSRSCSRPTTTRRSLRSNRTQLKRKPPRFEGKPNEKIGTAFRKAVASFAEADYIPVVRRYGLRPQGKPGTLTKIGAQRDIERAKVIAAHTDLSAPYPANVNGIALLSCGGPQPDAPINEESCWG